MVKFLALIFPLLFLPSVFAQEQLVLVVSPEMNSTVATMQRYEKRVRWQKIGEDIAVTLGRNGLGWAEGNEPLKREGDGRSPAGIFAISHTFGYDEHPNSAMAYLHADETRICIDDPSDERYNRIGILDPSNPPKSYEKMRRNDEVYRNGAVIDYNAAGEKGRGSCIFLHLNHPDRHPTSGCTAMEEIPLKELLLWLDPQKEPKILQIPRSECERYRKEFEGIECK